MCADWENSSTTCYLRLFSLPTIACCAFVVLTTQIPYSQILEIFRFRLLFSHRDTAFFIALWLFFAYFIELPKTKTASAWQVNYECRTAGKEWIKALDTVRQWGFFSSFLKALSEPRQYWCNMRTMSKGRKTCPTLRPNRNLWLRTLILL